MEKTGSEYIPVKLEDRQNLLIEKRRDAYKQLCDLVYEKKGYRQDAVPRRETVVKFGLMDEKADSLLKEYGEF